MKKGLIVSGIGLLLLVAFAAGFAIGKGPRPITLFLAGGGAADPAWQRLESVQAFDTLMGSVDDLRNMVLAEAESEREVAQGMRFILRDIAMTAESPGDPNPARPDSVRMDTTVRKIGGDNPDGEYHLATIDGRYSYGEIQRGTPGTPHRISYRFRPGDVARFHAYPVYKNTLSNRTNERLSRGDRRSVGFIDPLHRPLYVLHPSLAIRAYRGEGSQQVEVTDLRRQKRAPLLADN